MLQSGDARFPESGGEVHHKVSVISQYLLGGSDLVIPLSMSLIYKAFGFETALDIMGVLIGLNAIIFIGLVFRKNANEPI